jgi:mRNA interferase RelE/StbE
MKYTLVYHPKVKREDLLKIHAPDKKRIKHAIEEKLYNQPELFTKPLRKSLKGYRKLRVGDFRVILRINDCTIHIFAIIHRSKVYQQMGKRTC